jgi:TRAP-type C4-dicarboxylate transport system permease large subunit
LTILLLICIQFTAHFTNKIPKAEKRHISMSEKVSSLRLLVPIVVLFCVIIIGAYAGFFSATVGGAIGAGCVTLYAVFVKRMPLKEVFQCAVESIILNSNMFALLLAGTMFGRLITLTRLPDSLITAITNSHAPVIIVFTMIVIFYFVAGAVMDIMSCMLITVPIIFPLLTSLGFDSYAILIFLVIMINLGSISPPIGMGVFVAAQAVDVDPKVIFKGIWPYCLVNIACAYIIAFVPQIVNFLPNLFS